MASADMSYTARFSLLLLLTLPAFAQSPPTADQQHTMEALLSEIRQLRMTLEMSALLGPKVQLVLQRMALQDQRVARVSAQLESTRRELSQQKQEVERATRVLPQLEQQIAKETDGTRRKALEQDQEHIKQLANAPPDPQLLARESELASVLQSERAVSQELADKLDALDRQLNSRISK